MDQLALRKTKTAQPHQSTYLRVTYGGVDIPGISASQDGTKLVDQCIDSISDLSRFPPKLFILWATSAYQNNYPDLLAGINHSLADNNLETVPVVGSSVAVCLFDGHVCESGAVLICLASQFITADVASGLQVKKDPKGVISNLLEELNVTLQDEINPRRNQFLMSFLPGYDIDGAPQSYQAPEIVQQLREQTQGRVHLFGGVSSGGLTPKLGSQFIGNQVLTDSIVVTLVSSDVTYGIGLTRGLKETSNVFHIRELAEDGSAIKSFQEGSAKNIMDNLDLQSVFAWDVGNVDRIYTIPERDGDLIRLNHRIPDKERPLTVMRLDLDTMQEDRKALRQQVIRAFRIRHSSLEGVIGIGCASQFHAVKRAHLKIQPALEGLRLDFPNLVDVGCFMDGEIGVDSLDRGQFGNWSVSDLIFADDISARAHLYRGFDALAKYTPIVNQATSVKKAIEMSLECIGSAGYPGRMISLTLDDAEGKWIIAHTAQGGLWDKEILPHTRYKVKEGGLFQHLGEIKSAFYVPDTETCALVDNTVMISGNVMSFYAIPLYTETGSMIGVLQIDLGDMRDVRKLDDEQIALLNAMGAMISAAIDRSIRMEELNLSRQFDQAFTECLHHDNIEDMTSEFVNDIAKLIGADAHVRLYDESSSRLRLVAGAGKYFEAAKIERPEIETSEKKGSATTFRKNQIRIINDASKKDFWGTIPPRYMKGMLRVANQQTLAYARIPINLNGREPIGVFNIHSNTAWFFTQSRVRSLHDIGQRLYHLLILIQQKRLLKQSICNLEFYAKTHPKLQLIRA